MHLRWQKKTFNTLQSIVDPENRSKVTLGAWICNLISRKSMESRHDSTLCPAIPHRLDIKDRVVIFWDYLRCHYVVIRCKAPQSKSLNSPACGIRLSPQLVGWNKISDSAGNNLSCKTLKQGLSPSPWCSKHHAEGYKFGSIYTCGNRGLVHSAKHVPNASPNFSQGV
jgi:hypothetical protein